MRFQAESSTPSAILPMRTRHREELHCQIVHDSIHRREGWTLTYLLKVEDSPAGFGTVAISGPWKNKPTLFEFYVLPAYRLHAFELFDALRHASGAGFLEVQSNDALLTVMLHTQGREVGCEKIVFRDHDITAHPANHATLRLVTPFQEVRDAIEHRQGGGEWTLEVEGAEAGKGGILFHYNRPYGDIYMEIAEPFRRRGFGAYLVQELKRLCYELGAVPCARCNPSNIASRKTLQKAGLVPFANILYATLPPIHEDPAIPAVPT